MIEIYKNHILFIEIDLAYLPKMPQLMYQIFHIHEILTLCQNFSLVLDMQILPYINII